MPSSFTLTIDTAAPIVTWGAVTGAEAGETLSVGYSTDEPAIVSAIIELPDRRLGMTVGPTALTVDLPSDVPAGRATIFATVRDDVSNEAVRTFELVVVGHELVAAIPSSGGLPRPRPASRALRRFSGSAGSRASWSVTTTSRGAGRARALARWTTTTDRRPVVVARIRARSSYATNSTAVPVLARASLRGAYSVNRSDGPDETEALLLLGVL